MSLFQTALKGAQASEAALLDEVIGQLLGDILLSEQEPMRLHYRAHFIDQRGGHQCYRRQPAYLDVLGLAMQAFCRPLSSSARSKEQRLALVAGVFHRVASQADLTELADDVASQLAFAAFGSLDTHGRARVLAACRPVHLAQV